MPLKTNVSSSIMMLGISVLTLFNSCKKDNNSGSNKVPIISSFSPASGTTGTTVTITGTNFTGALSVKFGDVLASSFNLVNATTITAIVGTGATGNVTVTTSSGTATKGTFTYNTPPANAPTITSFTPSSGTTGASVTITGTNLTGATAVKFGNVNATSFSVVNTTTITAVVGSGATGDVAVTTPAGTATKAGFTFNTPPGANTIAGKINSDAELTQIKTGVATANLGSTLSATGPFTFFAPVDAALNALAVNFGTLDQATSNSIIRYHTVAGKYQSADIPAGTKNLKLLTINTPADSVFVTKVSSGVIYVNGKNIDDAKKDITADNGVIHKLNSTNGILLPPTRNVYDQISVAGYDSIKKLVDRATQADANLVNVLKTSVLTLVAPTNAAFQAFFSAGAVTQINQFTPAQALALVKDHVVLSRNFVIDFAVVSSTGFPAWGGSNLKFGSAGGGQFALYYLPTAGVLLGANDIMCFNGVIQRTGGILTK
jgi:uncharacterized surface protein with fasciclin (FAS1) repeats